MRDSHKDTEEYPRRDREIRLSSNRKPRRVLRPAEYACSDAGPLFAPFFLITGTAGNTCLLSIFAGRFAIAQPIIEDGRGHSLLVKLGWVGERRVRATTLHIRIVNEKFWIEEDMTEPCFADRLLEAGVPKEDIVLGFQSPKRRQFSEFAAT